MYTIYKIPLKDHPPITLSVTLYGQKEQKTKKKKEKLKMTERSV